MKEKIIARVIVINVAGLLGNFDYYQYCYYENGVFALFCEANI